MKPSRCLKAAAIFVLSFFLASHSLAGEPRSKPFLPDIPGEWTEIIPEPTEYMGRSLLPTCSGLPGTDDEFSFFVKGGIVNNLVIFFDGGGACWHSMNCIYPDLLTFTPVVDEDEMVDLAGIFDTNNPLNPFKNWSFVFIPYCTGDFHWGSNDMEYPDILNLHGGQSITIHHRGFDNFLVVLKWITETFRRPHKIFVTGSSAGSPGALSGFPYIQEAYPKSEVSMLGDAGSGVVSEDFHTIHMNNWNPQANFPDWIPGFERPFADYNIDEMYKMIAAYYPHSKVAQYTTAWDWTQTFIYKVMLNILDPMQWENWASVWCEWHEQMLNYTYSAAEAPNYRYYIGAGMDHTIIWNDKFYEENSAGVPFVEWVDAMVRNQGGTHGHGGIPWENLECFDCQQPVACIP